MASNPRPPGGRADRSGLWWSTLYSWRCGGSGRWSPGGDDQAGVGWHARRCRSRADGPRRHVATPSHTAHDLSPARICYRHHPFYDVEVEVVRYLRRTSPAIVVVRLPQGLQLAVPEWMLNPLFCEQLKDEARPRIAVAAFLELRRILDLQPLLNPIHQSRRCAKSPGGGANAQQRPSGLSPAETPLREQRGLDGASRRSAGTLSKPVQPTAGKGSEERRRQVE